jgi:hypothetical protein
MVERVIMEKQAQFEPLRKRVLMTTFTFPPNQDGVAMASFNLATGLITHGYVFLLTAKAETMPFALLEASASVFHLS